MMCNWLIAIKGEELQLLNIHQKGIQTVQQAKHYTVKTVLFSERKKEQKDSSLVNNAGADEDK